MSSRTDLRGVRVRSARGQATIETLVLTSILVLFVAAAYQLHTVNQSLYKALTASHQLLFQRAFARNCADHTSACEYSQDPGSEGLDGPDPRVIWDGMYGLPERGIPVTGTFMIPAMGSMILEGKGLSLPQITSNRSDWGPKGDGDYLCPGQPCKRTRVGAGTYKSLMGGLLALKDVHMDGIDIGNVVESLTSVGDYFGVSF